MDWGREVRLGLLVVLAAAAIFGPRWLRPADTCLHGDLNARLAGHVPAAAAPQYLDAVHIAVGLGAGAVGGWESLGEALAVGGTLWLRTTHPLSPNYYRLVRNRYFQSNAFVYVPGGRPAAGEWEITAPVSARALWEALAARYPYGVVAAGRLVFDPLRTIAVSVAAIRDEDLRRHAARYYTRPLEERPAAQAYLVAAVAGGEARRWLPALRRALPAPEPASHAAVLAHALVLERFTDRPVTVGQVLGDSVVARGRLVLYPIGRLGECAQALVRTPRPGD